MSTPTDVVNWVVNDMLKRPTTDTDILSTARNAFLNFYKVLCDKIPFDELQATSAPVNTVANQIAYTLGTDWRLIPKLRAIQNIQMVFDANNKRRLRKSAVRVYDALSFSPSSRPSTYARWDTRLELNPPPDSNAYTAIFRYWYRPVIGVLYNVTNAVVAAGNVSYTLDVSTTASYLGVQAGDVISVTSVNPSIYNLTNLTVTSTSGGNTVTGVWPYTGPAAPTYVLGGQLSCEAPTSTPFLWYNQPIVTPPAWDELLRWETLYRVYYALDQADKAAALCTPQGLPWQQGSPRKQQVFQTGIIPRLWNDLLQTVSQKENVDEDFSINPVIRPYSFR